MGQTAMIKMPNRIVTRAEAEARRWSWYFTGKPCKYGHTSTRNLHSGTCHACKRAKLTPVERARVLDRLRRKKVLECAVERRARLDKRKLDLAIKRMLA